RALFIDLLQARFDVAEPDSLLAEGPLQLRLLQHQHAADLVGRDLSIDHARDLLQRQAELLQGENAVEAAELVGAVIAVAGGRIDPLRAEQADAVVVAQQAAGDARDSREFSDSEHYSGRPGLLMASTVRLYAASKSSVFCPSIRVRRRLRVYPRPACRAALAPASKKGHSASPANDNHSQAGGSSEPRSIPDRLAHPAMAVHGRCLPPACLFRE